VTRCPTSSNLLHDEDQAVAVAVKPDADQLLYVTAGLTLVPQTTLPTLVDASACTQSLRDTLVATPHKPQACTPLVRHCGGIQTITLVLDTPRSDQRTRLDLPTGLLAADSQSGRRHDTDTALLHRILDRILGQVSRICTVEKLGFRVQSELHRDGVNSGRVRAEARLFPLNVLNHPFLERFHLVVGRSVDNEP
jgi:hypothetical protein